MQPVEQKPPQTEIPVMRQGSAATDRKCDQRSCGGAFLSASLRSSATLAWMRRAQVLTTPFQGMPRPFTRLLRFMFFTKEKPYHYLFLDSKRNTFGAGRSPLLHCQECGRPGAKLHSHSSVGVSSGKNGNCAQRRRALFVLNYAFP